MVDESDLSVIKQLELDLLDEFLRICNQYELDYFLSGGSCLGAIRHQGFIPWDDDIDISMPREDFERFSEIAIHELNEPFVFQSIKTEVNCGLVFGKIRREDTIYSENYSYHIPMSQGVWIDIFPYDNIPDQEKNQEHFYNHIQILKNAYILKCGYRFPEDKNKQELPLYLAGKMLVAPVPIKVLAHYLNAEMQKYSNQDTTYVIPFGGAYTFSKEKIPAQFLTEYIDVLFEGRVCKTIKQYDRYLSQLYGDYMQLPPIEERKAGVHNIHEFRIIER